MKLALLNFTVSVQEISLELTLGCSWIDARLKHLGGNRSEHDLLLLNPTVLNQIWLPDLFFGMPQYCQYAQCTVFFHIKLTLRFLPDGVKKISQPALLTKPMALKINSKGEVMHEGRWTASLACQMHFQYYPADT